MTWPGLAHAVRAAGLTLEAAGRWLGVSSSDFMDWLAEDAAPKSAILALRLASGALGYICGGWRGWRLEDDWIIAPNGRRVSRARLERLTGCADGARSSSSPGASSTSVS